MNWKWIELAGKVVGAIADAAEAAGAHDQAARLRAAIVGLRAERAETDAIHAETDAALEELERGEVDKRFDPGGP